MRIVTDLVDLQAATIAIRELAFPQNLLEAYMPTVERESVDYQLVTGGRFNRATKVRAFDAPTPIIGRPGVVEVKGGLPAISAMDVITESDAIRARRLAGIGNSDLVAANTSGVLARTTQAVQNKYELLRGQALSTGMIVLNENGVQQTADFNVPSTQKVTRAVAWTDPSADILTELFTWHQVYIDAAGESPGAILTSNRVWQLMLRNDAVRSLFSPMPSIVTPDALNGILQAYGLPPVQTYERKIEDATGTKQRVIAEERLIFLPSNQDPVGETQMGITESAVTLSERNVLVEEEAPGLVAVTLVNEEPVYKAGKTDSIGLPVLQREDAIVTAVVL